MVRPALDRWPGALALLLLAGCASQVDPPGPLVASPRLSAALDQLLPALAEPRPLAWRAADWGPADRDAAGTLVMAAPSPPPPSPPRPTRRPLVQVQAEPAKSPPRPPLPPDPAPAKPVRPPQIAWIPKLKPGPGPSPEPVTLAQAALSPAPLPSPAKPDLEAIMPAAGPLAQPPPANPLRAAATAPARLVLEPLASLAPGAARPGDGLPLATTPSVEIASSAISRAATDAVAVGGDDAGLGALSMAAREALLAGDPATALALYEQLALIVPNQRTALLGRAIALGQLGHQGEAQAAYQALLEADPDDLAARMAYLGLLAEVAPEQALRELRQLARRHPGDARLLGQIALAEAGRGDLTRAVAMLRRVVALDPMSPQHRINLAVMYDRSGQHRAAIEHYQKALALAMRSGQVTLPLDAIDARLRHLRRQSP